MVRIVSLVVAVAAIGVASYAVCSLHSQCGKLHELEESIGALEASLSRLPQTPAQDENHAPILQRLDALDSQLAALSREARPQAGNPSQAAPDREAVRQVVREVQQETAEERRQKRMVRMEQWRERAEAFAQERQQKQEERFSSWLTKFSESAGLTIAQEEGIRGAYDWAREERNRRISERVKEGGPGMFGPAMFKEIDEERRERIKEVLTAAQFEEFEDYRSKNPLPEMAFAHGFGPDGEAEAEIMIIEGGPVPKKKKEPAPEGEDRK